MRIRSIKPEFWRSEDICKLAWEDRLLFVGLWSYVDDNGVGRDVERLITSDLFPLEEDPRDTLATVSRGLQKLSEGSLITRYSVGGKPFLHISTWDKHQRIDKPAKARYPLPTRDDAIIRDTLATPSGDSRDTLAPGSGNRGTGNRGSVDQGEGNSATRGDAAPEPIEPVDGSAQDLIAEWIDYLDKRPPGNVIGQIAKHVGTMLKEGISYDDVRQGLIAWQAKSLHPSTLPSVVHEIRTATTTGTRSKRQAETDDIFSRAAKRNGLILTDENDSQRALGA